MNALTLEDIADLAVAQVAAEDRLAEQRAQAQEQTPPSMPLGCTICGGVDPMYGGTSSCPQCSQSLCPNCFPPTQHQPCCSSSQTRHELMQRQRAQTQAAQPELRATELAVEVWERLQVLLPPPLVSPSRVAVLRQAEFFLSGEYHLRHVMVHAADQVVTHFLLKKPDAMEEASGVSRRRRSDAEQSSDAGPSQVPPQRPSQMLLDQLHRTSRRKITRKG